jgi:hypothetical protein
MTGVTDGAKAVRGLRELRERRMRTDVFRAALPVMGSVALAAVIGAAGPAGAQDPPGNNGTIKVDDVEFDDLPNNEPHVGCTFQIDWYGYDEGADIESEVLFEAIPPTTTEGDGQELLSEDGIEIGGDPNDGGGSEQGLDASRTYDLTSGLQGITPHPEQGWHVRLTIHADGSQGADLKVKVFWVSGCEVPPTTSSTSSSTSSTTSTTETDGSTTTTMDRHDPTTTVPGGVGPSGSQQPGQPVDVEPTGSSGGLPITGSNSLGLLALAVGLVCIGTGAVITTRRLRATGDG